MAGVTLVLATPSAFSFLALSDRFPEASRESQQTLFLAAGEAVLASDLWHGSGALMGWLLIQTALLLLSILGRELWRLARRVEYPEPEIA